MLVVLKVRQRTSVSPWLGGGAVVRLGLVLGVSARHAGWPRLHVSHLGIHTQFRVSPSDAGPMAILYQWYPWYLKKQLMLCCGAGAC